jgi:hypothetical protein
MNDRQKKCPGCGLVSFRDAAECQWCALALSGRARTELIDDAPAAGKPWGLLLIAFALAIICGGIVWHVARKATTRAEESAAEQADAPAKKQARRAGPPSLSGRGPGDRQPGEITEEMMMEQIRRNQEGLERTNAMIRRANEAVEFKPRDLRERPAPQPSREPTPEEQRHAEADEPPPDDRDDR